MSVAQLIDTLSRKYGLDPRAVRAVAMGEGGLRNREGDVGDLSGGGSYGPFQLYAQGVLPRRFRGNPTAADSWAWSPAGIEYAIRHMSQAGARGLTGEAAINAIVRRFERPKDPDASVRNAIARYGGIRAGTVVGGPDRGFADRSAKGGGVDRQALISMLLDTPFNRPLDVMSLVALARGSSRTASAPPSSTGELGHNPAEGDWRPRAGSGKRVGRWKVTPALIEFSKRFNLQITSGFRSVAQQRAIYAGRSAPGSVAAPGKSYHNSGRAIDVAVSSSSKRAYEWALKHPGLFAEAFFDPMGVYIKNGKIVKGSIGGHSDHIHFALR